VNREQLAQLQEVYAAQLQAGRAPFVMAVSTAVAPFTEKSASSSPTVASP